MERGEPILVPEWYKGAGGSSSTSAVSNHHKEHSIGVLSKNKFPVSAYNQEVPRRSVASNCVVSNDKDSPTHSHPYSSFGRSRRDRDREKDFDPCDRDRFFLPDNGVRDAAKSSRNEKDTPRRSHSLISGRPVESWTKGPAKGLSTGDNCKAVTTAVINKISFERDFPSLGAEEKHGDVSRVSLGSSATIHGLPVGSLSMIGVDGWTSALVEPPAKVRGSEPVLSPASQITSADLPSPALGTTAGLNMAEALTHAPSRVRNVPQLSVDTQRIEELTRMQYSKLIPVTPSMSKSLLLNSSIKSKSKAAKSAELSAPLKLAQQPSSQLVNPVLRATARPDSPKTSQAWNFQVLNRERNGAPPSVKDSSNLTTCSRVMTPVGGISTAIAPPKSSITKVKTDYKGGVLTTAKKPFEEKRTLSQARNRNNFFDSLRKKTAMNQSASTPEVRDPVSPSSSKDLSLQMTGYSSDEWEKGNHASSNTGMDSFMENEKNASGYCDAGEESKQFVPDKVHESGSELVVPDEEEAAFLRSLGWEENAGEEALTAEEIDAFVKEYEKLRLSAKLSSERGKVAEDGDASETGCSAALSSK